MRYLSICSGIEAATAAWHPLGWEAAAFSEIEAFPRAVLKHHYPDTPLHGDFTTIQGDEYGPIDLLVGGTPCQSFSVAGLRGGLDDSRGNLALEFIKLARRTRARWLVWENVPGVLSSAGGRDFGSFLGGLAELGYGFAYRVLDAQFFGVPQRRRRVFVVGHLGDWRRAAAVLFERHSLSGDTPPRREKGQGTSERIARSVAIRGRDGTPQAELGEELANAILTPNGGRAGVGCGAILDGVAKPLGAHALSKGRGSDLDNTTYVPILDGAKGRTDKRGSRDGSAIGNPGDPMFALREGSSHAVALSWDTAASLTSNYGKQPDNSASARGLNLVAIQERAVSESPDVGPDGAGFRTDGQAYTLEARTVPQAVAWDFFQITTPINRQNRKPGDPCHTLAKDNADRATITQGSAVRRLTPRECERLQGFPDDYTLIPYRGKPAADGPRYKALGNSMAVPVMAWIGERIQMVEAICTEKVAA